MRRGMMQGGSKEPNTFIGGIAGTINTEALVAELFLVPTGSASNSERPLDPSEVKKLKIVGDNLECYISETVSLKSYLFNNNLLPFLKYIKKDKLNFGDNSLKGSTVKSISSFNDVYLISPGAGSDPRMLTNNSCFENINNCLFFFPFAKNIGRYQSFKNVKNSRLYVPEVISPVNNPGDSNRPFQSNTNLTIYVQKGLPINYPDAYNMLLGTGGTTIIEIQNNNKPASVTDLSLSRLGDIGTFYFTNIFAGVFYEVWQLDEANEGIWRCMGEISGSGKTKQINSTPGLKVKIATCDQYWNGSGFFKDETKRAFSNEVTLP